MGLGCRFPRGEAEALTWNSVRETIRVRMDESSAGRLSGRYCGEGGMATPHSMDEPLQSLASRIREHPSPLGSHRIRLSLQGEGGGVWTLQTDAAGVSLVPGEGDGPHTVEVIADVDAIRPVLEGSRDGRDAFLAGGIRVRGDVLAIEQFSAALGTHKPRSSGKGSADG